MAYTVLARKYRSQRFDEVVGQEPIAQTLKNAIKTNHVHHAYLFTGTRGVGKTTMARILAKALNCLSADAPTTEPCCKCDACTAINIGEDIDVIEIDGASNRGIDNIRQLRGNAIYRPARSRYKIYVIDEVHMLTTEAFNALLKTLEEPPSHIKFIFATTEPNKVIPTIQSRCQRFDFRNITPRLIARHLKLVLEQEGIEYEEELVLPLAKMANGSMRDGLSLLDRLISTGAAPLSAGLLSEYLGTPSAEKVQLLVERIGDSDAAGTLNAVDELISTGLSELQIADALVELTRDLMVIKSAGVDSELLILTKEQKQSAAKLAEKFDVAGLVYNISVLEKLRFTLKNSETARALLEAALLRLCLSEHFLNVDALLSSTETAAHKKKEVSSRKVPAEVGLGNERGGKTSREDFNAGQAAKSVNAGAAGDEVRDEAGVSAQPVRDLKSIRKCWGHILEATAARLGNSTAGLLSSAQPESFEGSVLTLSFGASGRIQKQLCGQNSRLEKIQSVVSEYLAQPVILKLTMAEKGSADEQGRTEQKTQSQKQNELINDPAVRTVVMGLDATITGIEEA